MNVTLYTKLGCVACNIVKRKLDHLGVKYTEVIGNDGRPVPRLEVDGKTLPLTRFLESVMMEKDYKGVLNVSKR